VLGIVQVGCFEAEAFVQVVADADLDRGLYVAGDGRETTRTGEETRATVDEEVDVAELAVSLFFGGGGEGWQAVNGLVEEFH